MSAVDQEHIKLLYKKQEGKCAKCGAQLTTFNNPIDDRLLCPECWTEPEGEPLRPNELKGQARDITENQSKTDSNALTPETTTRAIDGYLKIWQWSCIFTREEEVRGGFYFPQQSWIRLMCKLEQTQGNLVKVVGAQGVGKTTFAHWLKLSLATGLNALTVRFKRMEKGYEKFGQFETMHTYEEVEDPYDKGPDRKVLVTQKDWRWDIGDDCKNLIVDLWDYSKNSQREITKAIDGIQEYWTHRCWEREHTKENPPEIPNIVVFLQKEAVPLHFFIGKFQLFELQPWNPEQLVENYTDAFGSPKPFTKEALLELAMLSRGIFRRFKEYISATLEPYFMPEGWATKFNGEITKEDVQRIISTNRLVRDMELELSEFWPRSKTSRELAVKVLRFLRDRGPTLQSEIENEFFTDDKMGCSRMLSILALHGHLKSEQVAQTKRWEVVR